MTFTYELDPYSLEMYRMSENELPIRQVFRKVSTDRHRDRHDRNYIPRRFAGGQLSQENGHKVREIRGTVGTHSLFGVLVTHWRGRRRGRWIDDVRE